VTEQLANNAQGNLNASIIIDNELIVVGGRTGDTLTSLTRGSEGTTAASHSNGALVTLLITVAGLDAYAVVHKLADAKGDIVAATGADAFVRLPVGADGQALVADSSQTTGLKWTGGSSLIGVQVFTGSGTYTPTSGMNVCYIECVGGGGGGGGASATTDQVTGSAAPGGGGGAYSAARKTAADIGASKTVTIGGGGSGGAAGSTGGTGGDTSVGTLVVAKGGAGGSGVGAGGPTTVGGGAGGAAASGTGDAKLSGGTGQTAFVYVNTPVSGEGGTAPIMGGTPGHSYTARRAEINGVSGEAASGIGGGGSGGISTGGGGGQAGGAGAAGFVRIWEFG
jgi:hypothetical protein